MSCVRQKVDQPFPDLFAIVEKKDGGEQSQKQTAD